MEEETAICSSVLAWEIPQTEELGRLQSVGSQRAGHDLAQLSAEAAQRKRLGQGKRGLLSKTGFEHTFLGARPPHHSTAVWLLFWKSHGAMSRQEQQILGCPWHGLLARTGLVTITQVSGCLGFPGSSAVKNPPTVQETQFRSLGREAPLEEGTATHCSILEWNIPWTGEPGGLQSLGVTKSWP